MKEPVIRYTGGDPMQAHHSGIPARDLTTDDYNALDKTERETVRTSPIYDYQGYRDAQKAAKAAPVEAEKSVPAPPASPDDTPAPKGEPKK